MENKRFSFVLGLVSFVWFSCSYKENITTSHDVLISIRHIPESLPADGLSRTLISIELPDKTISTKRLITLTTSRGLFDIVSKNTTAIKAVNVLVNNVPKVMGTADLISSNDEGKAFINASIDNFNITDTILFTRAYPDLMHLQVDKLNYKQDGVAEVTMAVLLLRNIGSGTPSMGQKITIEVVDSLNRSIGIFRNKIELTDNTGKCVNYFSIPLTTIYTGKIMARASVPGNNNTLLTDSVSINVSH